MNNILEIKALNLSIDTARGAARILDHVDLCVPKGSICGIAGESGCGKSTLIKTILGILPPGARVNAGSIVFDETNLLNLAPKRFAEIVRGRGIGFIPQDPAKALNPLFRIGDQLLELVKWHGIPGERPESRRSGWKLRARDRILELLSAVEFADPKNVMSRFPHQFSGGQRQRITIAASLACGPKLIVADEPTAALDVTTQLQVLRLLRKISRELDLSILLVTHDFGILSLLCDRVAVMYAGQTVEQGETRQIIDDPKHPYTRRLIACHPDSAGAVLGIPGRVPSPLASPPGCRFESRCTCAMDACGSKFPISKPIGRTTVSCYLY